MPPLILMYLCVFHQMCLKCFAKSCLSAAWRSAYALAPPFSAGSSVSTSACLSNHHVDCQWRNCKIQCCSSTNSLTSSTPLVCWDSGFAPFNPNHWIYCQIVQGFLCDIYLSSRRLWSSPPSPLPVLQAIQIQNSLLPHTAVTLYWWPHPACMKFIWWSRKTLGGLGQAWVRSCTEKYGQARIQDIYVSYKRAL